jgi:AcrR family transcriptional regulator
MKVSQRLPRSPLRPRKSPIQSRSADTVAAIIEAAAQILEKEGFNGFNTNAVAERAGVSIGSLYQYFPGKDALVVALMKREAKRFRDDMAIALTKRGGKAALEYLIGASVRQQLLRPQLAKLLDIEEGRPGFRGEAADPEREELFVTVVKRAIPRHEHPDVAAGDLFAMVRGMVDMAGERGETDIAGLEQRVRAAVFGYLSKIGKSRTGTEKSRM